MGLHGALKREGIGRGKLDYNRLPGKLIVVVLVVRVGTEALEFLFSIGNYEGRGLRSDEGWYSSIRASIGP